MKIICIGRNYVEHAAEMKSEVPEKPVWFMKPQTAIINKNQPFYYPDFSKEIHHEVEVVVKIKKAGKHIQEKFAHLYYDEISIGLDLTARDLQAEAKKKGLPWEIAKAFDGSAPLGKFVSLSEFENIQNIDFRLLKNGEIIQASNTKNMIFSVDKLISYVSQFVSLKIGDLIFTGTPKGVGPVKIGDKLEAYLGEKLLLKTLVK
jgi:2-keto-4-pentenoate hydratase/2-oxohepta-3-ene-1,7-dioic acid hydratase in catechol pathway